MNYENWEDEVKKALIIGQPENLAPLIQQAISAQESKGKPYKKALADICAFAFFSAIEITEESVEEFLCRSVSTYPWEE